MPRPSAAVYRRRRLAVLLALLVAIAAIAAGVWLAIAQPRAGGADAGPVPAPTSTATEEAGDASPDPQPSDTPTPDATETPGVVACTADDVRVEAVTDADAYPADALPQLSIRLTNTSAHDCTMDVGSSTQKFEVASGEDPWWRSTDCQSEPSAMIVTLEAGSSVSSATPVVWDRTRSSVETCDDKNRPHAPAGGASYHVTVEIGGVSSDGSRQIILE